MPNSNKSDLRLAMLIDADNAPRTAMKDVMAEVATYGAPTVKRIYGDWTAPNMASWKPILLENAITPIQQYGYTTGKNATDSAMIIDAMDILYSGRVDGFVLVSSDSDFTRLAIRLREAGMKVYGMGEKKTPAPFIVACDKFVYIEVIRATREGERAKAQSALQQRTKRSEKKAVPEVSAPPESAPATQNTTGGDQRVPTEVVELIAEAVNSIADEEGYTFMGELGNLLLKKHPAFDPRNFGFTKLTNLVRALDRFEVHVRQTSLPHVKHIYVRDKEAKK